MPPKKKTKLSAENVEDSVEQSNVESLYKKKLEKSNDLEPFVRSVVINLMFASGDAEYPLQENEDLVVDLLKNELILLFNDVLAVHEPAIKKIKLSHMLPVLKTQKGVLSRFVKYLENRVEMAAIMKTKTYVNQSRENICGQEIEDEKNEQMEDEVDPMDDIGELEGAEGEYLKKKRKKLGSVTAEEALLQEVRKMFSQARMDISTYQQVKDIHYDEQSSALQVVIQDMTSSDYSKYSMARRASFQLHSPVLAASVNANPKKDNRKKKIITPVNNRNTLFTWLGDPPVQSESALVFVAFLAKEIVSGVVGAALVERYKRNPAFSGPLDNCYYEEFLRKNKKFRKYGRILL